MTPDVISIRSLVDGRASGELVVSEVGLSFWGGVDPVTGYVIDQHHPWSGQSLCNKIVALPSSRGSCSGSGVILELLLNGVAPAAFVFTEPEEIITLGVLVAEAMYECMAPVVIMENTELSALKSGQWASINGGQLWVADESQQLNFTAATSSSAVADSNSIADATYGEIRLTAEDQLFLRGDYGKAAQVAMHITLRMAAIQQAKELINVSQAHIDACVYSGKSSLLFAETLAAWGAQVKVPTTLNALSVDKRRWVEQGVDREFGTAASSVGDAYKAMGAQPTYTCAPYLLASTPKCGEHIVWAESNAVAYVNSVVGARTQKYPDFLDIFIALTGRAPAATAHLDSGRLPHLSIEVDAIENPDDSFWPLLGYHVGIIAISNIPLVFGLEELAPTPDELKAFSAAFATTSAMPMFHLYGVTPEAAEAEAYLNKAAAQSVSVTLTDLQATWLELNSAEDPAVGLICIGNPHVSVTELKSLAELCHARQKHPDVGVIVTLGREVHEDAMNAGYTQQLEDFGVQFINDTCWCMITEPVIPKSVKVLMTNSGKYAHYGPGLVQRDVHFGSMGECIDVACTGYRDRQFPTWLSSR